MKAGSWPLQKAIFTQLDADLSTAVYSSGNVPEGTAYPYTVIGNDTELGRLTKDSRVRDVDVEVTTWSDAASTKESKEISDTILQALSETAFDLSADSFAFIGSDVVESDVDEAEAGGKLLHFATVTVTATLQDTS